jgi:uncharacterized membrane protein YheB (UPF0754 family)
MSKNYSVPEVTELFNATVIGTFAATVKGQEQLNRIAKAITNESLDKRVVSMRETNAQKAFDKKVSEIATKTPDKLQDLVDRKTAWMEAWIDRKYGTEED